MVRGGLAPPEGRSGVQELLATCAAPHKGFMKSLHAALEDFILEVGHEEALEVHREVALMRLPCAQDRTCCY